MCLRVKTSQCGEEALNATHQSVSESEKNEIENALRVVVRTSNMRTAAAHYGIIPLLMQSKNKNGFPRK